MEFGKIREFRKHAARSLETRKRQLPDFHETRGALPEFRKLPDFQDRVARSGKSGIARQLPVIQEERGALPGNQEARGAIRKFMKFKMHASG